MGCWWNSGGEEAFPDKLIDIAWSFKGEPECQLGRRLEQPNSPFV